jgi:hypothetical protein
VDRSEGDAPRNPTGSHEESPENNLQDADNATEAAQEEMVSYANELLSGGLDTLLRHHREQDSYIGRGMLQILCEGLCEGGYSGNPRDHNNMDMSFALLGFEYPVVHIIRQVIFLVDYLEKGNAGRPVAEFLDCIKDIPTWDFPTEEEVGPGFCALSPRIEWPQFSKAWQTLFHAIEFAGDIPIQSTTFEGQIHKMFPPLLKRIPSSFTISLADLESVSLVVIRTMTPNEHLMLDGNYIKVLDLTGERYNLLHRYSKNRAAKYAIYLTYATKDFITIILGHWVLKALVKKFLRHSMACMAQTSSGRKRRLCKYFVQVPNCKK